MTPIEKLQAAIDKLEALKAESTPGTWRAWDSFSSDRAPRVYITGNNSGPSDGNRVARVENQENQDADLIVTLHRTIDTQLEILRFVVDGLYNLPEFIALADAILGSD